MRYLEADEAFAAYAFGGYAGQRQQLRILDDMFLARRIINKAGELLQTLVHQRYKIKRSLLVSFNRVVQDWGKYLRDSTMATTILDRLMHRAHILEFEGKCYRLKEAASRLTRLTSAEVKQD